MRPLPNFAHRPWRSRWGSALVVGGAHACLLCLGLVWGGQREVVLATPSAAVSWVRLLPVQRVQLAPVATAATASRVVAQVERRPATLPLPLPSPRPSFLPLPLSRPGPSQPVAATGAPEPAAKPAVQTADVPTADVPVATALASPPLSSPTSASTSATTPPRLTRAPQALPGNLMPVYPQAAREDGLEGPVSLRVQVDAQGSVRRVDWLRRSGLALLDLAARDAVRLWRFLPALQAGEPVAGSVDLVIRFRLDAGVVQLAQATQVAQTTPGGP